MRKRGSHSFGENLSPHYLSVCTKFELHGFTRSKNRKSHRKISKTGLFMVFIGYWRLLEMISNDRSPRPMLCWHALIWCFQGVFISTQSVSYRTSITTILVITENSGELIIKQINLHSVEDRRFSHTAEYQQEKLAVVSAAVVLDEISQKLLVVAIESGRDILKVNLHSLKQWIQHSESPPPPVVIDQIRPHLTTEITCRPYELTNASNTNNKAHRF